MQVKTSVSELFVLERGEKCVDCLVISCSSIDMLTEVSVEETPNSHTHLPYLPFPSPLTCPTQQWRLLTPASLIGGDNKVLGGGVREHCLYSTPTPTLQEKHNREHYLKLGVLCCRKSKYLSKTSLVYVCCLVCSS